MTLFLLSALVQALPASQGGRSALCVHSCGDRKNLMPHMLPEQM